MDHFRTGLHVIKCGGLRNTNQPQKRCLLNLKSDDRSVLVKFNPPTNSQNKDNYKVCQIPVDPAGGHCYWDPTKPCESRGFGPRLTAQ